MPTYCVICDTCGWRGEIEHSIYEPHPRCDQPKPKQPGMFVQGRFLHPTSPCGGTLETDVQAQGFPSIGSVRPWEGAESRSMSLGVNPDQIADAQRRAPSMKFDPKTGDAIFDSDQHHRKCLQEMSASTNRQRQREADRQGREDAQAEREGRAPPRALDIPGVD